MRYQNYGDVSGINTDLRKLTPNACVLMNDFLTFSLKMHCLNVYKIVGTIY